MRVLIDFAHNDLWESLVLLFEDRFGWEVYRPIGMEWYDRGIWNFERDRLRDQVARQFLERWGDDTQIRDTVLDPIATTEYSVRVDPQHPGRVYKMVTWEQAMDQSWDIVIATLAENEEGLCGFAHSKGAHYGIQIGNQGAANQWGMAEFALCSTTLPFSPPKPHVFYHQEFSLTEYRYEPVPVGNLVACRVQCITQTGEYERFVRLAGMVPEGTFRHFGHCGDHDELWGGDSHTIPLIAESMRATHVAYHPKRWSDGYGHVIHSWFAVGRPVIATSTYYQDKLAGPLFLDGINSWNLEKYGDHEIAETIRRLLLDDEFHETAALAARNRFDQVVSFDAEAEEIRRMFEGVLA